MPNDRLLTLFGHSVGHSVESPSLAAKGILCPLVRDQASEKCYTTAARRATEGDRACRAALVPLTAMLLLHISDIHFPSLPR